jgi:hypothetical protein
MFAACTDTLLFAKQVSIISSTSTSLPSFNVPATKTTIGKLHPSSKPLCYGGIHKAYYANCHKSRVPGLIIVGSGVDDWIY